MYTSDKKIIELIELLVYKKVYSSVRTFCVENNILEQTISKIKKGINHFTVLQIESICKKHNVNANWIFDIEDQMFIKTKNNQKSVQK